ncbi:14720_t:CDS:1, partial [Acaulospora colombiana]
DAGQRDSLLLWCEACYSKRTTAIDNPYCDPEGEELDASTLPSKIVSFTALEEELRRLGQQAGWTDFSIVVHDLWQGEDEGMRRICLELSTLVHEHTGYKFTS